MRRPARSALWLLVLIWLLPALAGCSLPSLEPTPVAPATATPVLPPADAAAFAFLQAWEREEYPAMYALLSPESQQQTTEAEFTAAYTDVVNEALILGVSSRILSAFQPDTRAEVSYASAFHTASVGDFEVQNQMTLSYQQGRWGVNWSPSLILPQLSDETVLRLTTSTPSRGNIYDRNGLGLAVQGELVEIGVVPGEIEDEAALLDLVSTVLGKPAADLQALYAEARPDWYVPLGQISPETGQRYYEALSAMPGVELHEAWTRSYHPGQIAPHVVGVVGPIPSDELEQWRSQGYSGDELVGRMGLERWGEHFLVGQRGGRLEILSTNGHLVAVLGERQAHESSSLYTTFDRDFQKQVQDILGQRLGAIVVLEAKTGRVLALATYPRFDPNLFPTGIDSYQWANLQSDPRRPLVNRATQGTYPPGSVFKIVTMAAGMDAAGLTADSTFLCRGVWTGLGPQWPKTCWLRSGHGRIPLDKALTVSCDITFYQVGLTLNGVGQEVLPDYARRVGFGARTGIEVEEAAGLVPDPAWKIQVKGEGWAPGDSVNLAIGQGELLVTPLQVAVMVAAVGNGGTLYRPQVVETIAADPQHPEWQFEPVEAGRFPLDEANLAVIQDSLHKVTAAEYGTAYRAFEGFDLPVAGKTGTAESGQQKPHAWFAGYAPADDPEIAIVVIVEHAGEGSMYAAPLWRQVAETYFRVGETPEITPTLTITPTASP